MKTRALEAREWGASGKAKQIMRRVKPYKNQRPTLPEIKIKDKRATWLLMGAFAARLLSETPVHNKRKANVPKRAEYLLYLLLSKKDREGILGDLAEDYLKVRSKFGRGAANFWYYIQVMGSAWPLIRKAGRWGALAWVAESLRRLI
jgi:hypothetical protein